MYTQCPDCSTAFRVTAEVLKQAAGKVRCGGCGVAFNALEYLSEQVPEQPASKEVEEHLPELTPEPQPPEGGGPASISAEQSAALLKTLDELAGSDIRIEDTGVEWRVLDDDAGGDDPLSTALDVDELLDESPTPVDQFLTKTPNDIDASEIFEESANAPAQTPVEELRFDDNTPLPDEFNLDDESSYTPEASETVAADSAAEPGSRMQLAHPRELDEAPAEIALGEPEEWADILGEFAEPPKPYVPPLDAELAALDEAESESESESEYEDEDVVDEPVDVGDVETPLDVDTQFALQAEAMGIDISGVHENYGDDAPLAPPVAGTADDQGSEAPLADEKLDEPSALEASDAEMDVQEADTGQALALSDEPSDEPTGEVPELELADETGEALQLADEEQAAGDDAPEFAAGGAQPDEHEHGSAEHDSGPTGDAPLEFGSVEQAMAELEEQSDVFDSDFFEEDDDESAVAERTQEDHDDIDLPDDEQIDLADGLENDEEINLEDALEDDDAIVLEDNPAGEDDIVLEDDAADGDGNIAESVVEDDDGALEEQQEIIEPPHDEAAPHFVPPQSEEEQTLNRLIDQELLSMAVEDEDGFASTIVVPEKDAEEAVAEVQAQRPGDDDGFESIIMEGEFVRSALDQEKRKADIAAAAELAEQARRAREAEEKQTGSGKRRGMAAAAVFLLLILAVQVLHQSREALATIPVFNETVGPLYRAIGLPLSPAWDVTGWQFEARQEILDEEADTLTVISRIGNTSEKPLPYPVINISLTDRFEETVGTQTLDPSDYLTDDLDPGNKVQPGSNFTAVMTIQSPSDNATGYKLQACYRQPDAALRCHIPTFK